VSIIGSLILFKGETLSAINPVLIVVAVVILAFFVFVIAKVVRVHRRHEEMRIIVLPKTTLGKWSVGLAIAFIVVFAIAAGLLNDRWGLDENGNLINPVLTVVLTIIIVAPSGAALVTGLISVIKRRERSVLVFLGMLITFWWGIVGGVGAFFI
jgi:hypothetical protein